LLEEEITGSINNALFIVHRELGFGFLEHVYASALEVELRSAGHTVARQFGVDVWYGGVPVAHQRLDMVVDSRVAVEIKSTERLHPEAERQLLNYLRATRFEVGLVLHFGRSAAFRRVVYSNANKRRPHDTSIQPEVIDEAPPL
jgi:GxxExxY protein